MRIYVYGSSDTTGDPSAPGTVIVFADSRNDADDRARSIYGDEPGEPMLETEVVPGLTLVASSYYGVDVEVYESA